MARRCVARGHEATVLCVKDRGRAGIDSYVEDGLEYVEVPDLLPGRMRSGWDLWDLLNRWFYLKQHHEFDLIHLVETRPATIYPLLWLFRNKPIPLVIDWVDWWGRGGIITTNRPGWYRLLFGGIETFYEERFRTLANATTVVSEALRTRAEGLGVVPDSIFKVPIGVDADQFPRISPSVNRAEFGLKPEDQVAVFSALDGLMDVELVFDAVRIVLQSCPRFKLVMTGKYADQLVCRAEKKGLGEHFVHLGFLPQDRFVRALTCADLFLLPFADKIYNHGRWPCKIGDYFSVGRPVVSNPIGEVLLIMKDQEAGVLTDIDPEHFAGGIIGVLSAPEKALKMGEQARFVAETELSWAGIIDELERAYQYALIGSSA